MYIFGNKAQEALILVQKGIDPGVEAQQEKQL